jgi:hypothetical protein
VQVVLANKGGLVVQVEGLRGFVPFSQISAVWYFVLPQLKSFGVYSSFLFNL